VLGSCKLPVTRGHAAGVEDAKKTVVGESLPFGLRAGLRSQMTKPERFEGQIDKTLSGKDS
jgi:hypothetical protein